MKTRVFAAFVLLVAVVLLPTVTEARARGWRRVSWNAGYYDPAWGAPHALVVPPTARSETVYNWGVTGTEVHRIRPQFGRAWPGPYAGGAGYQPTPSWPQSTDQFGTYYVRAPWK